MWRTGGIGRSPRFSTAMLTAILFAVISCAEDPIAEPGSRADRVFVMANDGDSTAQTALGLLYERGLGVPHDPALALVWYRRAADQGDALAEFHIGSLYERGLGVRRKYSEAAAWYERASDKGNESAQAALAYLYDRGLGVERDFGEAEALYGQASASWAESNSYPAESTFATGRQGPALASPNTISTTVGDQRPEFSAGQKEAPTIEVDLAALDDALESAAVVAVFDGPEPIAGRGENFPLATGSLTPSEQTRVAEPSAPLRNVQFGTADSESNRLPLLPSRKPVKLAILPSAERLPAAAEVSAEKKLIASLESKLDEEAAAFEALLDAAEGKEKESDEVVPEPLRPAPEIFMISLATFETRALAEAEWEIISKNHAGLVGRLPHKYQPVDIGGDSQFFELIVGPLDSPVQSRLLCGALRAHGHGCWTIDK